jgi:hypothetical protein
MRFRTAALCSLGLAAALTLGASATASAQVDTSGRARSTTRIPVRKDGGSAPRVDTVTVTVNY